MGRTSWRLEGAGHRETGLNVYAGKKCLVATAAAARAARSDFHQEFVDSVARMLARGPLPLCDLQIYSGGPTDGAEERRREEKRREQ